MNDDRYDLSTGDVAELLAVSVPTIARWADAGELPCIRTVGGSRRFKTADVEKFIDEAKARQAQAVGQYHEPSTRGGTVQGDHDASERAAS